MDSLPQIEAELISKLKLDTEHHKQKDFTNSLASIRAFFGGNRVGKTEVGAHEVVRFAFNTHDVRKIDLPAEIWVCCPSYELQVDSTQKKLLDLIPRHRIVSPKEINPIKPIKVIQLDNGTTIRFKSYEQGAEKFQSAEKDLIWFDEEPPYSIWEECIVRQGAGRNLNLILTMTPVNGMTWVYDQIYLATNNPDIYVVTAGWDDNPFLEQEQIEKMARGLSKDALEYRRYGRFTKRAGLVCNWWDREIHLVDFIKQESSWRIYRIIDFGWSSSKTCVLWIAVDSRDRVYIFDGIYENELEDDKLAKIIKDREKNFTVSVGLADNASPDRIQTLALNGVYCTPIDKTSTGENWDEARAESMQEIGRIDYLTNKSRLFVSSALTRYDEDKQLMVNWFVEEVEAMMWKDKKSREGQKLISKWNKDSGNSKGSHFDAIDTFSYFCMFYLKKFKKPQKKKEVFKKNVRNIWKR